MRRAKFDTVTVGDEKFDIPSQISDEIERLTAHVLGKCNEDHCPVCYEEIYNGPHFPSQWRSYSCDKCGWSGPEEPYYITWFRAEDCTYFDEENGEFNPILPPATRHIPSMDPSITTTGFQWSSGDPRMIGMKPIVAHSMGNLHS